MAARILDDENETPSAKRQKILHNDSSKDDTFKFDFVTLKNIARAKIVSSLWMNTEIQKNITYFLQNYRTYGRTYYSYPFDSKMKTSWKQIERNVSSKASELRLPKIIICNELKNIIEPFGKAILGWIFQLHYHMLKEHERIFDGIKHFKKCFAVDYIEDIKWTTCGKIDYRETAKCILTKENSGLSNDYKYKLACDFCLEDAITAAAPHVVKPHYLNSVDREIHPMVYYWTSQITGEQITTILNQGYEEDKLSRNELIIWFLLNERHSFEGTHFVNEVAIKYMWGKLSKEKQSKYIECLVRTPGNYSLKYYLLSHFNFEEQREIFAKCCTYILKDISDDWFLEEQFLPTALHFLDIMDPESFSKTMSVLQDKIVESLKIAESLKKRQHIVVYNQWKSNFKELWQKAPKHLKDAFYECSTFQYLIRELSCKTDIDIIELLLTDISMEQKREIIFNDCGIWKCEKLIIDGQWDLLNTFIEHMLFSENDKSALKQRIVQISGSDIAEELKQKNARDRMECFLNWAFTSDEEKIQFMQRAFPLHSRCTRRSSWLKTNSIKKYLELFN